MDYKHNNYGGKRKREAYSSSKRYKKQYSSIGDRVLGGAGGTPKPEMKAVDLDFIHPLFDVTGNPTLLNGAVPGAQSYQRIGRRVCLKSILIRGMINFGAHNNNFADDCVRILVIYDRQSNGATPALADVIQSQSPAGVPITSPYSPMNINNTRRFLVLKDQSWAMNQIFVVPQVANVGTNLQPSSALTDYTTLHFKWYINRKLKNLLTEFNAGAAGTVADITSGAVYLFAIGKWGAGAGNWACDFCSRVRFCDL